ncbi:FKBP-type peptidyl-prolyl cis-trans isomerase [Sphingobacterium hotanense]|uniref:FKBP-type peptidyl-prolyl cis-trans isomerase n=1 Tax=Sphingobacterium hotanense TaxID=649196 RepID=UPI0021A46A9E|nr:FKBP-type peptidyl-prolyl cis-trans isomerase [Sphingobacterium hotanense]MCT1526392.1 FKBP-type peptidyl-prolyl cis-trans isomerase [Sphingobacterium hotanense]
MRLILGLLSICFALNTSAQSLKTANDSLSYALGLDVGRNLKQLDFQVNQDVLAKAIKQALEKKDQRFTESQTNEIIRSGLNRLGEEKIAKTKAASQAYLDQNKKKPGVITTAEGLQYQVLQEGTGLHPKPNDMVVVHYRGTLADGTVFDNSYERNEPLDIEIGRTIPGWIIGIPTMKVGGKTRFVIPYDLGYGERSSGPIPAYSTLIFEVELLKIISEEPHESI